jgi:hypothetical protein
VGALLEYLQPRSRNQRLIPGRLLRSGLVVSARGQEHRKPKLTEARSPIVVLQETSRIKLARSPHGVVDLRAQAFHRLVHFRRPRVESREMSLVKHQRRLLYSGESVTRGFVLGEDSLVSAEAPPAAFERP